MQDTVGMEKRGSSGIPRAYYRNAEVVLLVYDVTAPSTFELLPSYLSEIRKHGKMGVQVALIGNKSDLRRPGSVDLQYALAFARRVGIRWCFETSCLDGTGVQEAFAHVCANTAMQLEADKQIYAALRGGDKAKSNSFYLLHEDAGKKKKPCC
uniref:Uncharacterized protein n=1 Tax=Eutreptiella gymnastica TaxID=73025 RepID=A0A7S1IF30_9EUGL|mmetsp:Transcript_151235/g.264262  ORF Transcript_151235/g.264262 Transcript_151235/m.264262 type:complete len:153 (+) Transcript_151235:3-461(+)